MACSRSNDHARVLRFVEQVPDALSSPQSPVTWTSPFGLLADSNWIDVWRTLVTHIHQQLPRVATVVAQPRTAWTFFNSAGEHTMQPIPVIELYFISLQDVAELREICRSLPASCRVLRLFQPRLFDARLPQDYEAVQWNFRLTGFCYLSAAVSAGTHSHDAAAYAVLYANRETLQEVVLDMPAVEAVAKTFEHFATLHQSNGQATPSTVTRIHERPSTDPPSVDQDPPPTVIDLEILKEFRIIVSVRGDIPAATEANVAKILDFFEKVVTYNANIILELRYGSGTIPSNEEANDIRLKTQSGPGFTALYDALKAARPEDGDSSTSGQPRAKDVALVLVEDKEENPETWDEIGVPQVPPAVSATACGGKDPMPPPS
ncbi:hypothetical protein K466DRAFT_627224 [Polyporus arcularius HHB13444]|uniref:Uncharacterized protein n=1 Tax=Polyporus arcularius HHB13444 TaxID=1314778 RepID=A0A5C3PQP0_9APHY|nr:hypothetical protein K466DRAFT_627224 [Polyporus arcularius HHB13444]